MKSIMSTIMFITVLILSSCNEGGGSGIENKKFPGKGIVTAGQCSMGDCQTAIKVIYPEKYYGIVDNFYRLYGSTGDTVNIVISDYSVPGEDIISRDISFYVK